MTDGVVIGRKVFNKFTSSQGDTHMRLDKKITNSELAEGREIDSSRDR